MNNILCKLVVIFMLSSNSVFSEIRLEKKLDPVNSARYQTTDWNVAYERGFLDVWGKSVAADAVRDGVTHNGYIVNGYSTLLTYNDEYYYIIPLQYFSREQYIYDENIKGKETEFHPVIPGGGVCSIMVYNTDLQRIGKFDANLPEQSHSTFCNDMKDIRVAKNHEGIFMSLSYYLTTEKFATRMEDIGKGWRDMTVFFRIIKHGDGIKLVQDDTCLKNPNNYDTISRAIKALDRCNQNKASYLQ